MSDACPVPGPDDPLVRGLLGVVDCNVQSVVQTGYASLFQPGGAFVGVLTVLMTIYVALIGYRLLLGRATLDVGELALTTVKLAAVLALATQWGTYQALVYRLLFYGPEQIATVILHGLRANGSVVGGNVYDGLQRAFTDMTAFSPATPPGAPAAAAPVAPVIGGAVAGGPVAAGAGQLSTLLSQAGFDSLLLLGSAVVLLLSSLGVLLASKIVLAILLAVGPLFIAMLLFETTQGLFVGWLRAILGFAFVPLAVTLTLGLALTLLDPSLQQLETMRSDSLYLPGVAFAVAVLVAVFSAVSFGLIAAGGMIAAGLKPPQRRSAIAATGRSLARPAAPAEAAAQPRAARIAAAAVAQARRDTAAFTPAAARLALAGPGGGGVDRRTSMTTVTDRGGPGLPPVETRIGQTSRRASGPRIGRSGPRSAGASSEGPGGR